MTIFEKNMAAIRERDPALAGRVESSPPSPRIARETGHGRVTLKVKTADGEGALRFPDMKPPALDTAAGELAGARMVALLGFGSGRLLAEIVSRTSEQTFVLLIEPDIDLFASALREADLSSALSHGRVTLAVGETPNAATFVKVEGEYSVFTLTDFIVIENPWSAPLYPGYFAEIRRKLEELKSLGEQNVITMTHMGARWRENIFKNLPAILKSPPVSEMFGAYRGVPAFIVAAGPSLDKNARALGALEGKGVVIAVDTAVRKILREGVTPDIVVSLDAKEDNYLHLAGVRLPETLMVFNPVAHPKIVDEHEGPMTFSGYSEPMFEWLETVIGERGRVRTGGSVATSAFDLAVKMGCSPIVLVGQDLSYGEEKTHASGTVADISGVRTGGLDENLLMDSFETRDIFGRTAITTVKMDSWRRWFELIIAHDSVFAVNATEGGVPISGAAAATLAEAIARYALRDEPIPPVFKTAAAAREDVDHAAVAEAITKLRDEARSVKSICARGIAAVKSVLPHVGENGAADREGGESFSRMKDFSREILNNTLFMEVNRWSVDKTLDAVDRLRRRGGELEGRDGSLVMMEAYRVLFSGFYDIASGFEKSAGRAVKSLGGAGRQVT